MDAATEAVGMADVAPQQRPPVVAEYIDRLVTVEMRNRGRLANTIGPLYEAARAEAGGQVLTYQAADGLASRPKVRQRCHHHRGRFGTSYPKG